MHFDVCGSCPISTKLGFRYFITFVDDYSHVTWLYLMKNRSEVFFVFQNFCAEMKNQFTASIRVF